MSLRVRATIMQTPAPDRLDVIDDAVVDVDDHGTITAIRAAGDVDDDRAPDVTLPAPTVLLPGLVDCHIHAPQWPQLGTGLDLPLERWLFEYTFPLELRLTDPAFAAEVWPDLVGALLARGTTTASYFATVSVETTTMLAETCARLGQRALVGRVAMDHPDGTPDWYRDADAAAGIAASRRSIEEISAIGGDLVRPVITPRFIPACTDELLAGLGRLAAETGVGIQTHCSESDWQHDLAVDRYGISDTEALDRFGLVRPHTILAHGTHLADGDLDLIAGRGAGVAHCPLSNAYFAGAVFPARRAVDRGVHVGLGTDVAGGGRPDLWSQCADAVTASRIRSAGVDARIPAELRGDAGAAIDIVTAFWMATKGGADLLDLPVGLLEVGRSFDAIAVDTALPGSPLRWWPDLDVDPVRRFEKLVRLVGPEHLRHVWVAGRRVPPDEPDGRARPVPS